MNSRQPDLLKPTLIAGLVFGVAAAIPLVSALNLCCCAHAWGAGLLAAFLYSRKSRAAGVLFGGSQGAKVGFFAGTIYAFTATVLICALFFALGGSARMLEQMEEASERFPFISGEALEAVRDLADRGWFPVAMAFGYLAFFMLSAAIFSTLGGLLGGAVFKYEPPPPPVLPPPPPPTASGWGGEPPVAPDAG